MLTHRIAILSNLIIFIKAGRADLLERAIRVLGQGASSNPRASDKKDPKGYLAKSKRRWHQPDKDIIYSLFFILFITYNKILIYR